VGGGRATRSTPRLGRGRAFLRPAKRLYRLRTSNGRILPSAIVIGAQKCGTSALYHYLSRHPAIGSAGTKEVHYFDQRYDQGVAWYRSHFPTARAARRLAAAGDASQPIAIEASPYYLAHPLVPYRIRGLLPDARLLVLLRDPVDRAISHHNHEVEDGNETLSFAEAIEVEGERLRGEEERLLATPLYRSFNHQHFSYLMRGRYAEQLEVWFSLFGREPFLILDSASLFADPRATVCRVCEFLGVPPPPPLQYRPIGVRSYRGLDAHSRALLEQYFAPHNARLWELLGEEFSWS
jgi:sulfotransferase family protein